MLLAFLPLFLKTFQTRLLLLLTLASFFLFTFRLQFGGFLRGFLAFSFFNLTLFLRTFFGLLPLLFLFFQPLRLFNFLPFLPLFFQTDAFSFHSCFFTFQSLRILLRSRSGPGLDRRRGF